MHEKQRLLMYKKKAAAEPKARGGQKELLGKCSRIQESYWNLQLSYRPLQYYHFPLLRLSGRQKQRYQPDQATVFQSLRSRLSE